jgi:hypothetical protein
MATEFLTIRGVTGWFANLSVLAFASLLVPSASLVLPRFEAVAVRGRASLVLF